LNKILDANLSVQTKVQGEEKELRSGQMGPQVGSDKPAGFVGRSCCTANRAEEGNAATGMRREERLDRQSSGGRADAEIATRTARQGRGELGVGQWNLELGAG
jgi:hypothetical protein